MDDLDYGGIYDDGNYHPEEDKNIFDGVDLDPYDFLGIIADLQAGRAPRYWIYKPIK